MSRQHSKHSTQHMSSKMLASTVQFSTNNQPPPRNAPTSPSTLGGLGTGTALTKKPNRHPQRRHRVRSLRTQQRAYDRRPTHHPVPRTPPGGAVLGTGGVSRRPNWSAFHP